MLDLCVSVSSAGSLDRGISKGRPARPSGASDRRVRPAAPPHPARTGRPTSSAERSAPDSVRTGSTHRRQHRRQSVRTRFVPVQRYRLPLSFVQRTNAVLTRSAQMASSRVRTVFVPTSNAWAVGAVSTRVATYEPTSRARRASHACRGSSRAVRGRGRGLALDLGRVAVSGAARSRARRGLGRVAVSGASRSRARRGLARVAVWRAARSRARRARVAAALAARSCGFSRVRVTERLVHSAAGLARIRLRALAARRTRFALRRLARLAGALARLASALALLATHLLALALGRRRDRLAALALHANGRISDQDTVARRRGEAVRLPDP